MSEPVVWRGTSQSVIIAFLVVLSVSAFAGFRGIEREEYSTDEPMWIYIAQKTWPLFRSGQWDDPAWENIDATWGYVNPPVAKYLLGSALEAQGTRWEWEGRTRPPDPVLVAARRPSAVLGVLGSVGLLWIGLHVFPVRTAALAALMLAVSPLWIQAARQAMTDIYGASMAILAVCAFVPALVEMDGRWRIRVLVPWVALSGTCAGLAVGAKLNAASTPAFLGGMLLLALLRALIVRPRDRFRAGLVLALGLMFAATAVASFTGTNPYLHKDGWNRFWGIIAFWKEMSLDRAARSVAGGFGSAFYPEQEGVRILSGRFVAPFRPAAFALLVAPAATLILLRLRRVPASSARLVGWVLLVPAALIVASGQSPLVHAWLPWVGFLGAMLAATTFARADLGACLRSGARALTPVWLAFALFFVWRMTFLPQPRYYLPILPVYCLVAGWGLASLRYDVECAGRRWPRMLVDAGILAGALCVIAAFPTYDLASAKDILTEAPLRARVLLWTSVVLFLAAATGGLLRASPEGRHLSRDRGPSGT